MDWTQRLNAHPGRIPMDGVDVDVYHWAELADTVANPPHRHTYFEVCWVEGGTGVFVVDGRAHPIGPGALLFARPGVRHQIISAEAPGIRLSWVAFHLRLPDRDGAPTSGTAPAPHRGVGDHKLTKLFDAFSRSERFLTHDTHGQVSTLWTALRVTGTGPALPGRHAAATAVATALVVALAQAGTETLRPQPVAVAGAPTDRTAAATGTSAAVRQALRYIHDNLDGALQVDTLARHAHLSRRQFTRLFTAQVGRSPAAYVTQARLDHAAALLVRTDLPIKRIAATVGYGDLTRFTRAFTRRLGTPPGRFRHAADLDPVLTAPVPDRQAGGPAAQ